jgi:tetratricopeptide (TPR) repeat protein
LQLGILYLKIEDYENAEKYMKRAIAADSSLADAYQLLGHLYEIKQRWQESLGYYLTFLEKNPQGLKQTFERILTVSLQAKELEKPIVFLQKVIAEGDTSSWAAEQLGRLYYHHQEFDKALDLLRQLKQNETLSDNGYFVLGFLYARADSFSSAVEAFERVKTSRPDFIPNYLTLGRIYYRMGEMEKASGAFEEGLAKAPPGDREDSRELMFSLADVYNERGDDQKTEYFLKRVLEKDPDYAPALNFLGYFYALRGTNLKEAQELIARALKQDPKNGHYIDSMGWVLFRMGRLKAALDYIKDSLAKLGGHPEVYEHLGDIYFAMGKKDQAIEAWNKSLALKGDNESLKKKLEELSPGAGKGNNK